MSNLSDLLPSGGGQNIVDFTASGTVASGKPVVLNANGTVSQVAETSVSQAVGSAVNFESGDTAQTACVYDTTNDKVVIFYKDSGDTNKGKAVVGTVSGTSITFGSVVEFESDQTNYIDAAFDPVRNEIVVVYANDSQSSKGYARIGTVSGTSISFTSATIFESDTITDLTINYDVAADRFMVAYRNASNSNYGECKRGTNTGAILGTSTAVVFQSNSVAGILDSAYSTTDSKSVIAYLKGGEPNAITATISGNSISVGSSQEIQGSAGDQVAIAYDTSTNRFVFLFRDAGNSYRPTIRTFELSGTSITSLSSEVTLSSSSGEDYALVYDSNANKVTAFFRQSSSGTKAVVITDTSSGGAAAGSEFAASATVNTNASAVFDPDTKTIVNAYQNTSSSNRGDAFVYTNAYTSTNLTSTNFIGLADAAISDTATGKINVKGSINSKQSSLTIGSDYYVQSDGTVTTTSTSPAVKIGQAVTATTINMMDLT
jgi:hypothetical protein